MHPLWLAALLAAILANSTGIATFADAEDSSMKQRIQGPLSAFGKATTWTAANVTVDWTVAAGTACPPVDNQGIAWIDIKIPHNVPTFFPFVPGGGQIATETRFRMEPMP